MCPNNLLSKEVLTEICLQLKQLRLEQQLSLEELQEATHLSLKVLRRMENGQVSAFCLLSSVA